jgi:hypothetical protein
MNEYICIRENYFNSTYWYVGNKVRADECPNHHFIPLDNGAQEKVRQIINEEIEPDAVDLGEKITKKKNR